MSVVVTTMTLERPVESDDELTHYFCPCDEYRGLCGKDLTDAAVTLERETDCIVCVHMDAFVCERCGE